MFVSGLTQFELACLLELSSDGWSEVVGDSVEEQGTWKVKYTDTQILGYSEPGVPSS